MARESDRKPVALARLDEVTAPTSGVMCTILDDRDRPSLPAFEEKAEPGSRPDHLRRSIRIKS